MPRNGSGTYSLPVGNPVVTGTTISSTWANNTLTDISNALTGSLSADGQTTASGNLNMGTNRIVNAGDPQNAQDVATKYYVDELIAALGTMAYQDADAVDITGGDVVNITLDLHQMTNEVYLPVGPTSLRTASPIQGIMRFNTDGPFYEGYVNGAWHRFLTANQGSYTVTYLAVGGGGGAKDIGSSGTWNSGGAGGGKVVANTTGVIPGTSVLTITIGGGGAAGSNGSSSIITGIVDATGGSTNPQSSGNASGGSSGNGYTGGGGVGDGGGGSGQGGGGGAGATANGGNAAFSEPYFVAGAGGAGAESLITGTSAYFGGGGGGGSYNAGGAGGVGGGGQGNGGQSATNGTINTGGGGGGYYGTGNGGNGGSGVVFLSMPTINYSGTTTGTPTVTTTGSNTVLKFTSSGTYTC
jgi:hypothetical protein